KTRAPGQSGNAAGGDDDLSYRAVVVIGYVEVGPVAGYAVGAGEPGGCAQAIGRPRASGTAGKCADGPRGENQLQNGVVAVVGQVQVGPVAGHMCRAVAVKRPGSAGYACNRGDGAVQRQ